MAVHCRWPVVQALHLHIMNQHDIVDQWVLDRHPVGVHTPGRALGVGEVKFTGQVTPAVKKVVYKIDLKRVILRKLVMGIGEGVMEADGKVIYETKDLKVGLFTPEQMG